MKRQHVVSPKHSVTQSFVSKRRETLKMEEESLISFEFESTLPEWVSGGRGVKPQKLVYSLSPSSQDLSRDGQDCDLLWPPF